MDFRPPEGGEKLEQNEGEEYCEFCERKKNGCNNTNWLRHKKACKKRGEQYLIIVLQNI